MLHIVRWEPTAGRVETMTIEQCRACDHAAHAGSILWIDLDGPTAEEESYAFGELLKVHPLTLEDITKPRREPENGPHLPKVEEFADYLFVIVNPLPAEADIRRRSRKTRPQLSAVLTRSILITHHYAPLPCIAEGQSNLSKHPDWLKRGPDFVFHLILDGIVDEYAPMVEKLADRLDGLEAKLFRDPSPRLLAKLLRVKREVSYLRKTMILEREVLARLIRGEFDLVDQREIAYYRNVFDHLVRYTELIESAREMVSDLMQTHLSAASNRLNEVMKVLTIFSVIAAICTVIAGIYGMNFKKMPEIDWEWGYPMALGLMAITVVLALIGFRWKKWL